MPDVVVTHIDTTPPPSSESIAHDKGTDSGELGQHALAHKPLFDIFGLTRPSDLENTNHNKALAEIWDYAKQIAPNKDKESVLFEVMRLKSRLGKSGMENNPYLRVQMYVKSYNQMKQSEQRMRELEGN